MDEIINKFPPVSNSRGVFRAKDAITGGQGGVFDILVFKGQDGNLPLF
jgi:hypothetical protein